MARIQGRFAVINFAVFNFGNWTTQILPSKIKSLLTVHALPLSIELNALVHQFHYFPTHAMLTLHATVGLFYLTEVFACVEKLLPISK